MVSPARQQYLNLKHQYEDAILLYRLGDFYEMFDRDAEIASKVLGIQLTARSYPRGEGRIPMAGVPHHSVRSYIKRLVDAGHRVALCEQTSEPGKGLVDRDVVRVYTPGTLIEPDMLQPGENNFLAAVNASKGNLGLAFVDITTGEFRATEFSGPAARVGLEAELLRLDPAECLFLENGYGAIDLPPSIPRGPERRRLDRKLADDLLCRTLRVASLDGFGLHDLPQATMAAATIVDYLQDTNREALDQIALIRTYSTERFMMLDRFTRYSFELIPRAGETKRWTLLRVLDRTKTGMGARRLRAMIGQPLLDPHDIDARLDQVECLTKASMLVRRLGNNLSEIGDVERIMGRVAQNRSSAGDLRQLRLSLMQVREVRELIQSEGGGLAPVAAALDPCDDVCETIERAIGAEGELGVKRGYSSELDTLRDSISGSREAILAMEKREIEASGIKSLKIGYNKVFGYYIEVGKASADKAPPHYVRLQTLLNVERYFTPEIKDLENRILSATEAASDLERQLLEALVTAVQAQQERIMRTAAAVADLDASRSLADAALAYNYVRPVLDESSHLRIVKGRHPVVEVANTDVAFVPNDCLFDDEGRIVVLMGPNMGGKSTMLRMVALIVLMAQIGSFVPAEEAHIGIVDRIFSRVGAQDDISAGQSTFMTEMVETSNILHHATSTSLLILDEVGRGTSTYDGLAIARAVIEYIHGRIGARTLFATHYHELAALETELDHVRNFHTAVADRDNKVVFLHKVVPGPADRSYGIHVARLAGLPHSVTVRAERILRGLERNANGAKPAAGPQLALFDDPDLIPKSETEEVAVRILDRLLALDLSNTTPLEALERLHQFQEEGRSSG